MVQERLEGILDAAIREFIATGVPVSSEHLFENYDFGIRSARIRSGLQELTKDGFLEQHHHSAGRVPTDRGYEFFVGRVLAYDKPSASVDRDRKLAHFFEHGEWDEFVEGFSRELGVLGVLEDCARNEVYKEGLDMLVEKLDWGFPEEIKNAIRDFEEIEERLGRVRDAMHGDEVRVFIGKKSPVTKSSQLSVVVGEHNEHGRRVFVLAIGPKRMNYEKVIRAFRKF